MVEKVNRARKLFDLAIFTQLLRIVSNESYVNALEEMILAEKLGVFDNDKAAKVSSKVIKDVAKEIRACSGCSRRGRYWKRTGELLISTPFRV
ncbi:MAG: hypothetical protein NO117_05305 [Sulfolobales archaeon]|nr:hypothetical protein [Sulfolobales archaeon]